MGQGFFFFKFGGLEAGMYTAVCRGGASWGIFRAKASIKIELFAVCTNDPSQAELWLCPHLVQYSGVLVLGFVMEKY